MTRLTKTGQVRKINRSSLRESTQYAMTTHQDAKIPDGPIVIDRDLLQDIRDLLDTASDEYKECRDLRDKLDNLYPFLNQSK